MASALNNTREKMTQVVNLAVSCTVFQTIVCMCHRVIVYKIVYLVMYIAHVMESEVKSFTNDCTKRFVNAQATQGGF